MPLPAKKSPNQLARSLLVEPAMTPEDWRVYVEGWRLFNERRFWHAHEAWESIWLHKTEDSRIFFQGIIQLVAALHLLLDTKRFGGAMKNLDKAEEKLRLFTGCFLGIDIAILLGAIDAARKEAYRAGKETLERFDPTVVPFITPRRSTSPL